MKILVTGGAGFIGSHIVDKLIEEGHEVRALDLMEPQVHPQKPDYLNSKAEYVLGDIRDSGTIRKALEGVEVVSHHAAAVGIGQSMYQISKYVDVNSLGTAKLLQEIISGDFSVKKLIVASSVVIYGEGAYECGDCGVVYPRVRDKKQMDAKEWELKCPKCGKTAKPIPVKEDKPKNPTNVYAITKRSQEELCHAMGLAYGIPTVALRYFIGYGVRQSMSNPYTGVPMIFSARIKSGKPPLVYEDGLQTRDFINVKDIVRANLLVMKSNAANYESFNVGTGKQTTILDLARMLIRLYGKEGELKPDVQNQYRASDVRHLFADTSKISKLGFEPKVSVEEGMRELVEWGKTIKSEDKTERAEKEMRERGLIK